MSTDALQSEVLLSTLRTLGLLWRRTLSFRRDARELSASIPGARSPLRCERSVRSGEDKSELALTKKEEIHTD